MKRKEIDVMGLIREFQTSVLNSAPSFEQMLADVCMMRFKVRPLQGDISVLNISNHTLVETLWRLGKMDAFVELHGNGISKKNMKTFYHYFDSLHKHLQERLNNVQLIERKKTHQPQQPSILEMEIFKEKGRKKVN